MKNLLSTLTLLFVTSALFAQIGVSGSYSTIKTSGWDDIMNGEDIRAYDPGYVIGLDYWFKLKEYRVEFLPEVSYAAFDNKHNGPTLVPEALPSDLKIIAFSFNTQIYLFDLEGDCNCPTWGKEGGFFNKGFFLMAGPGVSFVQQDDELRLGQMENINASTSTTRLMLSAGIGLDIGISKAITLTAFGKYRWHQSAQWDSLETYAIDSQTEDQYEDYNSVITQLQPGLKVSYRWNE